jgi:hypothetical protein
MLESLMSSQMRSRQGFSSMGCDDAIVGYGL